MSTSKEADNNNETTWTNGLFDCCSPGELCLITTFLPCITYGKTQHRIKHGNLEDYSCFNGSCIIFTLVSYCGLQCIPATMQRGDIRDKYSLKGGCFGDFCKSCWCTCCVLMQNEKESEQREALLRGSSEPYRPNGGMVYPEGN